MPVDLQGLRPEVRSAWNQAGPALRRAGVDATVTSAYRSPAQQAAIDPATNPYPVAPAGTSLHEKGRALDISIPDDQRDTALPILAQFGFINNVPHDPVHFSFQGAPGAVPRAQGGAPPVLPPVPGAPVTATRPGVTAAAPPGAGYPPGAPLPWWLDQGQLDQFDQRHGLNGPAAPAAASQGSAPWWLDSAALDQFDQKLGLNESAPPPLPGAPVVGAPVAGAPTSALTPEQIQVLINQPEHSQVDWYPGTFGGFVPPAVSAPAPAPLPPPPVSRVPSPWPGLAQGLLSGRPAVGNAPPAQIEAGLTPAQLLFGGGNSTSLPGMVSPYQAAIDRYRQALQQLSFMPQAPPIRPPTL